MASEGLETYYDYQRGIPEKDCTCVMTSEPKYHGHNGPQPAEWEQNPDCPLHGYDEQERPMAKNDNAPEPYYRARVTIEKITLAYETEDQYGREKTKTLRDKVQVSELTVSSNYIRQLKERLKGHIELIQDVDFAGEEGNN